MLLWYLEEYCSMRAVCGWVLSISPSCAVVSVSAQTGTNLGINHLSGAQCDRWVTYGPLAM